jgi:hypothetical protein
MYQHVDCRGPTCMSNITSTRSQQADDLTQILLRAVKTNTRLNAIVRCLLAALGLGAMISALIYTLAHASSIVTALADDSPEGASLVERVFTQTWPVILLIALSVMTMVAAWVAHARGQEELERASDCVGRLRREAEVAIPARGLTHVFEEKLANARRAYILQLWLGRALFLVSLGLFSAAVINALAGGESLVTATFTAGSIVGVLFGTARRVPRTIARHLADVVQVQAAITGCDRQIGMFENYAYKLLKDKRATDDALGALIVVHERIETVVDNAIKRVERYADPGEAPEDKRADESTDVPSQTLHAVRSGL